MKLINGDCMHELKTMDDDIFDLIITDPPYTQTTKTNKSTAFAKWKHNPADLSVMEYYHDSLFSELTRVAKPDGNIYVFCDDQSYPIMWKSILPHVRGRQMLDLEKIPNARPHMAAFIRNDIVGHYG